MENDEAIAHALQDELSRLAVSEPSRPSHNGEGNQLASILSNDQLGPLNRHGSVGIGKASIAILIH